MARQRATTARPGGSPLDPPVLGEVVLLDERVAEREAYPFTVPALAGFRRLELERRVTFFVGENGSGKSTLLEAIAIAAGFGAEGGTRNFSATTTAATRDVQPLADALRLSWGGPKLRDGFFLRAESLFNVASRIDELGVTRSYGGSLHTRSHGEAFLAIVEHRFGAGGLYLLDEPEAALSPQRQLTLLVHFHRVLPVSVHDSGRTPLVAS